jgi:hypothetical protein
MKKTILFFTAFLATFASFGQNVRVSVALHTIVGYGQHENFARQAATALAQVLNSSEFRIRMLAMSYERTNGLTNQQLYDAIMRAHEVQGEGGQDSVVDLRARTIRINADENNWADNCNSSTIGIDGNADGVTAICPNILDTWANANRIDELAGHFAHEYIHILGFDHYKLLSSQSWREKTFVYKIGNLVSELIAQQMRRSS